MAALYRILCEDCQLSVFEPERFELLEGTRRMASGLATGEQSMADLEGLVRTELAGLLCRDLEPGAE